MVDLICLILAGADILSEPDKNTVGSGRGSSGSGYGDGDAFGYGSGIGSGHGYGSGAGWGYALDGYDVRIENLVVLEVYPKKKFRWSI